MTLNQLQAALACATAAARRAGQIMRTHLALPKKITAQQQHDIKLELDVRCQKLIEQKLHSFSPVVSLLGEEGVSGLADADYRWVVDPIDGTVNFTYGIPHACVSIALQQKGAFNPASSRPTRANRSTEPYETIVGVVYDPFCDELFTAVRGQAARLNNRPISVSARRRLRESIVSIGFSKDKETLEEMLPRLIYLVHRVRKIRITGAAALALVYVASGRFDAYIESGVRLWDIAAGGLILECAGGEFWRHAISGEYRYRINANNGLLRRKIEAKS